ncbi:hypothetical protein M8C21_030573, partial [Ambrosia artemisiifolia]
ICFSQDPSSPKSHTPALVTLLLLKTHRHKHTTAPPRNGLFKHFSNEAAVETTNILLLNDPFNTRLIVVQHLKIRFWIAELGLFLEAEKLVSAPEESAQNRRNQ